MGSSELEMTIMIIIETDVTASENERVLTERPEVGSVRLYDMNGLYDL